MDWFVHEVDYYELLGVRRGASPAEIKAAYRSLAKAAHPDAGGTAGMFHLLRTAYDTLADPDSRADYDDDSEQPVIPEVRTAARPTRWQRQRPAARRFGEDPGFVPRAPEIDVSSLGWWDEVDVREGIRHGDGPGHCPPASALAGLGLLVLPLLLQVELDAGVVIGWLALAVAVAAIVRWTARRYVTLARAERAFAAEFGDRRASGKPGTDADQIGERLTADLLSRYLTRLPAVRIFHGLAWPGSVFADVDHAVLCGKRLVLIESKMWLPGHYTADGTGLLRNDRPFRGGGSRLSEGLDAYRELLPGVDVRGVLMVYPSRDGEITTGDPADAEIPPMIPEQFVREVGRWLATEPSTVDTPTYRAVLAQVAGMP